MHIHFVCTGNVYRSRIASTYLKSKKLEKVEVTSSGTDAKNDMFGHITRTAKNFLEGQGIKEFDKKTWTQTTKKELQKADLIVFMEDVHHKWCKENLNYLGDNFEVWGVQDIRKKEIMSSILTKVDDMVDRLNLE